MKYTQIKVSLNPSSLVAVVFLCNFLVLNMEPLQTVAISCSIKDKKKGKKECEISTELTLASSFYTRQINNNGSRKNLQPTNALAFGGNRKRSYNGDHTPMPMRKKVCIQKPEPEKKKGWGYSTTLVLYEDPWKIKKVLTKSDLGSLSRLLLATNLVEDLVVPVLGADAKNLVETDAGIPIQFWDLDTDSMHNLILKKWPSSQSYVFIGSWYVEFVKRRELNKGDEIGLHWDSYRNRFHFSVLKRAIPNEDM